MRTPSRRVLPTVIGVAALTTLAANGAVVLARAQGDQQSRAGQAPAAQRYVAASDNSALTPQNVAVTPLRRRLSPHLMVAGPTTLPADLVEKVKKVKGVRGVELVDAAQALVAGKRVGLLGVNPSTFRSYTPGPTAESDALWRNVTVGDVAISFTMGNDGGVKLGSQVPIGGKQRQTQTRVGAYATMGIGEVDAVVSRPTAHRLGVPTGNALIVSAPKVPYATLAKKLKKLLPEKAKTVQLSAKIDVPTGKQLPTTRGQVMTAQQIQTAIAAARTRLGWPYVWGGESEAEGGYDCSGLLQYSFARAGVRLPRVAADQARAGWIIPFNKAQPGDLLIWAHDPTAPGYISHIALYIGGGKMIAAPRRGTVVQVQNVYFNNFRGAVRVSPAIGAKIAG